MATLTVSNKFKFEKGQGNINFASDTFKLALMNALFVFDEDSHGKWGDVSASEISSNGGYAQQTLSVDTAWAQDNGNDRAQIEWSDPTFSAAGAAFDDFIAAIIYDDTHADDVILGCITFDAAITVPNGQSFFIQSLGYRSS